MEKNVIRWILFFHFFELNSQARGFGKSYMDVEEVWGIQVLQLSMIYYAANERTEFDTIFPVRDSGNKVNNLIKFVRLV